MTRPCLAAFLLLPLVACTGTPSAEQRAATDLNPSGRPYVGPVRQRVTEPPADINTFDPLNCHPEGQGAVCGRAAGG